jgi:hypothetical protein
VRVSASDSLQDLSPTSGLALYPDAPSAVTPLGAFLIVDGVRVFPLEAVVINIGRREDNQLVVDDPRVSRLHAQLRIVRGQFVIFDGPTGGLCQWSAIHQYTLREDLLQVPLVFGQRDPEREIRRGPAE